jgi:hypothetical protein
MNIETEDEIITEEGDLYRYWKILVKRKKVFFGIFLVPLVIVTIISLSLPRYYRGEGEITNPLIPAPNIVSLIGNIDDTKKIRILGSNAGVIKSMSVSLPKKTIDKVIIIVDAKAADFIPQAFKDIFYYLNNLPEIKAEIARMQAETDLKDERLLAETDIRMKKLLEAKEANLVFLNDIKDMIKKRKLTVVNYNPSDLIRKDGDISLEIISVEQARSGVLKKQELRQKVNAGVLGPPAITKQPSNAQIKSIIIFTGLLSLLSGILVVFFIDYIERMKEREKK